MAPDGIRLAGVLEGAQTLPAKALTAAGRGHTSETNMNERRANFGYEDLMPAGEENYLGQAIHNCRCRLS